MEKLKNGFQNLKLTTRIFVTFIGVCIPFIILLSSWAYYIFHYNSKYASLVSNASIVSDFSLDF